MYTEYERNGFMDHVKIALLTHCKKNIFKICYHNIFSFVKSTL